VARIERAGLGVPAVRVWRALSGSLLGAAVIGALLGGGAAAVLGPGAVVAAAAVALTMARGRADRVVDRDLPALLDALGGGLRAGASLPAGLERASARTSGPLGHDLRRITAATTTGRPLPDAIADWGRRRATTGVRLTVSALLLSLELGASSRPLEGVARTLRDRAVVERDLATASAQAKLSVLVMVAMPVAFVAFGAAGDPGMLPFLLGTATGLACVLAAGLLDGFGAWWMARMMGGIR
jgi:Flp pilus assembly protein TadB